MWCTFNGISITWNDVKINFGIGFLDRNKIGKKRGRSGKTAAFYLVGN